MKIKVRKKICIWLMACCVICSGAENVKAAGTWPEGPQIEGEYAVVMELETGTVLYEKNAHTKLYPASITKIMTALLAVENSKMEEEVTFSYDSVHKTEGSGIWRDVDEVMTMEQCLYALMLNSANECAYAIAEHIGDSYEDFVQMMNDRAKKLGCQDTHFNNPHGLTDEEHYTSCYDIALISREALQNEMFCQLTSTKRYEIPPTNKHPDEITYLKNHQKMLFSDEEYYYEYCIGGKTGYTEAAGNTLVTFAKKDDMTLICVVMKETPTLQYEDSIVLLNDCFDRFRSYYIAENLGEDQKAKLPESGFLSQEAFADIDPEEKVILPIDADFGDVEWEAVTDEKEKDAVGMLRFQYAGHVVGTADIKKTGVEVKEFPFGKQQPKEDAPEQKKVVRVNVLMIIFIIFGILALGAAGFGIYKFGDNFYLLRYKFKSRRGRQNLREGILKRKRRGRK